MGVIMKRFLIFSLIAFIAVFTACQNPDDGLVNAPVDKEIAPAIEPTATNAVIEWEGVTYDIGISDIELADGSMLTQKILEIIGASRNHIEFRLRLLMYLNKLVRQGVITKEQREAIWRALRDRRIP
jgi:hypothetical protein